MNFIVHYPILIPFVAVLIAEMLKAAIDLTDNRKKIRFINPGGMPSGHSAFVVSMATYIGFEEGPESHLFMVAVVVALIVMYDAIHLRNEAGQHAKYLNLLRSNAHLEESLGHTKLEVLAGALVGFLVTSLMLY